MSTFRVSIKADADVERTRVDFLRYASNAADMTPAMQAIGDDLRFLARVQFDSEGAVRPSSKSVAGAWKPLSGPYEDWKLRNGYDPRVGHRTGRMRRSYTTKRGRDHVEFAGPEGIVFGSNVPYAGHFNDKRPILPTTARDAQRWAKLVQLHILSNRR